MSPTGIACALVAGLGLAYAVEEARRLHSGRLMRHVGRTQALRRILGALLVAVLMVLVYLGLDLVEPHGAPRRFIVLWCTVALLTLVLIGLALLDLGELYRNRRRELATLARRREAGGAPPEQD